MKCTWKSRKQIERSSEVAFSLIELLVAVSILTGIVFLLYSMFNQTQQLLRSNVAQVDVLEQGRMAVDLLGREIEQMEPAGFYDAANLFVKLGPQETVTQAMPGSNSPRTNVIQDFMFLTQTGNVWYATGYRVIGANNGVGSLARVHVRNLDHRVGPTNLLNDFLLAPTNVFQNVAEGVVHLRLRAFTPEGHEFNWLRNTNINHLTDLADGGNTRVYWLHSPQVDPYGPLNANLLPPNVRVAQSRLNTSDMLFTSNAVPGFVELELGVLEPQAYDQLKSIPDETSARDFLSRQAGKVHLFRKLIPIRSATR